MELPLLLVSHAIFIFRHLARITVLTSVFVFLVYTDGPTFNLSRENPSFHNTAGFLMIALLSASMGLQGVVGESLGSGVSRYASLRFVPRG